MQKQPSSIIIDIIKNELALPDTSVWLRDQNREIPQDDGLYIAVGSTDETVIANNAEVQFDDSGAETIMTEIQSTTIRASIQIDVFSRSTEALLRRWEVLTAMTSQYAQQQMEQYQFRIFAVPNSFVNTSDAEGGSVINRYSIIFSTHAWYRKEKVLQSNDYYNDFDTRVDDEDTIGQPEGLIEFNIKEEGV